MVEEKRKRGRPKKIRESVLLGRTVMEESCLGKMTDQSYRRDELVVGMIMAVLNKQGNIKWDFALDLFDTGTKLAYQFGWMDEPKQKKAVAVLNPQVGNNLGGPVEDGGESSQISPLANTPGDIWAAMHNK